MWFIQLVNPKLHPLFSTFIVTNCNFRKLSLKTIQLSSNEAMLYNHITTIANSLWLFIVHWSRPLHTHLRIESAKTHISFALWKQAHWSPPVLIWLQSVYLSGLIQFNNLIIAELSRGNSDNYCMTCITWVQKSCRHIIHPCVYFIGYPLRKLLAWTWHLNSKIIRDASNLMLALWLQL